MTEHIDVGLPTRVPIPEPGDVITMDEGYPKIVFDQRELHGCRTVDDVKTYWTEFLAQHDLEPMLDTEGRTLTPRIGPVASSTRSGWIADCPACNTGIALWDENPQGCCLGCGLLFEVDWQDPTLRSEVLRLLAVRPVEYHIWNPWESTEQLKVQNQVLGLVEDAQIPDEFIDPSVYLDHLRTVDLKAG